MGHILKDDVVYIDGTSIEQAFINSGIKRLPKGITALIKKESTIKREALPATFLFSVEHNEYLGMDLVYELNNVKLYYIILTESFVVIK